jgi:hypothetical protein
VIPLQDSEQRTTERVIEMIREDNSSVYMAIEKSIRDSPDLTSNEAVDSVAKQRYISKMIILY